MSFFLAVSDCFSSFAQSETWKNPDGRTLLAEPNMHVACIAMATTPTPHRQAGRKEAGWGLGRYGRASAMGERCQLPWWSPDTKDRHWSETRSLKRQWDLVSCEREKSLGQKTLVKAGASRKSSITDTELQQPPCLLLENHWGWRWTKVNKAETISDRTG